MKKTVACLSALIGVLSLSGPSADAFTLIGAETLPEQNQGLRVGVGYPSLYAAWHIPLAPRLEIAPKVSFFYGWDTHTVIGNKAGAEIRINLWKEDELGLGLVFDPAVVAAYHPELELGFQIGGPGVVLSYTVEGQYSVTGGVKLPFGFVFLPDVPDYAPDFWASVPILFVLGGEYSLAKDLNLFATLELGPDIVVRSGKDREPRLNEKGEEDGTDVQFSPNFHFGISYLF